MHIMLFAFMPLSLRIFHIKIRLPVFRVVAFTMFYYSNRGLFENVSEYNEVLWELVRK